MAEKTEILTTRTPKKLADFYRKFTKPPSRKLSGVLCDALEIAKTKIEKDGFEKGE